MGVIYKKAKVCLQLTDKETKVGVEYQLPEMYFMHLYGIGIIKPYAITNVIIDITDVKSQDLLLQYIRDDVSRLPDSERKHLKKIYKGISNIGEFDLYILVSFDDYKYRMKLGALSSILP